MRKSEIDWTFDHDIPTMSFFEDVNPDDPGDLEEVVDNFKFAMKAGTFLTWEAVILEEQDLPLCEEHEEALEQLLNFSDEDDEILYINDLPRYDQPWYEILRRIVPHLLIDPFDTSATRSHDLLEAWPDLYRCVEEHGPSLSLPEGVTSPTQVIDASLQHRLWLQFCFAELAGLGERDQWRLDKKEQRERIEWFLDRLRGHRSTVEFLKLTADKLLEMLVLPEAEQDLLVQELRSRLGLRSMNELIADRL